MSVIWHDLECGTYEADLSLWRALGAEHGGPVLDIGAGTGRVTLALARDGLEVTALDHDPELLAELGRRAARYPVTTVCADGRSFRLTERFALILVPMQTVQLLGGPSGRERLLTRAREHLRDGGRIAIAITAQLDPFDVQDGAIAPLPDVCERDGTVYSSLPTAVRVDGDGYVLERRRETVTSDGTHRSERDRIHLDAVDAATLEAEARHAGLRGRGRAEVAATDEHVGSQVVILGA